MTHRWKQFWCGLVLTGWALGLRAGEAKTNTAPESPLSPVAFLAGSEWVAKLPNKPGEPEVAIRAKFNWAENHQAIRISNQFVMGGKPAPYLDGIYAWNPGKKTIVFWYADAEGSLYEGKVVPDGKVLVHEFQVTEANGSTKQYEARVARDGADAWTNEISVRDGSHLEPIVKVRYERAK